MATVEGQLQAQRGQLNAARQKHMLLSCKLLLDRSSTADVLTFAASNNAAAGTLL
jgi:hypothetical protein